MKFSKSLYVPVIAAGLLMLPATALGAGFQNSGQSATATSMGYSGVANPDEPNSSFYNPASMGLGEGLKLYLGDTIIMPSTSWTPADGGEQVPTKSQIFPPPNGHLSYENIADSGVSAGVGVTFPYGLGIAWPDDWAGRTAVRSQDLQTTNVNPNVAYKIADGLSVAAGGQIVFSSVEFHQSIATGDDQFVEAHLGAAGMGFGGVAAAMYQPLEELTLGLQYRSRVKIDYEGDVHFDGEEDGALYRTFRDNPATASITLPDSFALGVGYELGELFVTAEANYTMWQTYDVVEVEVDTGGDEDAIDGFEIVSNWEDAMAFRLGAQYDVMENLPVRMGLAYDMTPIPDETVNPSLPGNDRLVGSLGFGYTWEGLRTDVAYSLVHALERDIDNDRAPHGAYNTTANIVAINLGYGY